MIYALIIFLSTQTQIHSDVVKLQNPTQIADMRFLTSVNTEPHQCKGLGEDMPVSINKKKQKPVYKFELNIEPLNDQDQRDKLSQKIQ